MKVELSLNHSQYCHSGYKLDTWLEKGDQSKIWKVWFHATITGITALTEAWIAWPHGGPLGNELLKTPR